MTINKKTLEMLASLPDDKLIGMLSLISGGSFSRSLDPSMLRGIRAVIDELSDDDVSRGMSLLSVYKRAVGRK